MAILNDKLDIVVLNDYLKQSVLDEDDILLDFYLKSYLELNKFFTSLGTIFGFVSSDLLDKVQIIQKFLDTAQVCDHFKSAKTMIEYETADGLLKRNNYVSGSRTLLRLHRGLNFFKTFLEKLLHLKDDDSTSAACRAAYDETLSHHHSFAVRHGAKFAMYTLPHRGDLLKRVCKDEEHVSTTLDLMPEVLLTIDKVYNRIEDLYSKYDLHSLP